MSRSRLAAVLVLLLIVGCSSGGDVTVDELTDSQIDSQQDAVRLMQCSSWGMVFHHQWAPDFDGEQALRLATEYAESLEPEGAVAEVVQIASGLWAIGDPEGVAIGVVDATEVVFCYRRESRES